VVSWADAALCRSTVAVCTSYIRFGNARACLRKYARLVVCLGQPILSLFLWSIARRGLWDMWQHRSSHLRKAEPGAVGHVATPEFTLSMRKGPELRDTWQRRSSPQQGGEVRGHGTHGNAGALLSDEVRSGAVGHVVASEPTFVGRCGPKLQLTWQRVDARHALFLDLKLIYGGTRSSGCRQRPPGPPQDRLQTRRWGQFFGAPFSYLDLYTR
jgi:hypothetical protein